MSVNTINILASTGKANKYPLYNGSALLPPYSSRKVQNLALAADSAYEYSKLASMELCVLKSGP